ncbi:VWA domain-containing protein [Nocardia australiensis]|uniref:VWA domain-containing protein n=1 Tax=Nocardia australiensis TaxID=2887191 RepID=UPI001D136542|nr:substrate-binding domain-containing protein [Nocardia australiensis]
MFTWFQFRDRANSRDSAAAAECVEGASTLHVTVDPDIAAPVRTIADQYNATKPRVRDHCAQVEVTAQASAAMVAAFTSNAPWNDQLGPQPALWIADSMRSVESVRVPGLIEGNPTPVAASPIVLAVPEDLRRALDQAKVAWADLPRLQQGSLSELGLTGWNGLRVALPPGDATTAVAAAVGSAVSGTEPLSDKAAQSGQVVSAISLLAENAPQTRDTIAALGAMTGSPQLSSAPVHAVATTTQQIKAVGGSSGFSPVGATPVADYPAALMSGPWVDKTQNLIASIFADYLRTPQSAQTFTAAGFDPAPAATAPVPSRTALDKVRATLAHPVLGVQSTVLLDVSASMGNADGSGTRLTNVLAALASTMNVMPPDFGLGVWTFGKNLDGTTTPYKVQAATAPLTDNQRSTVTSTFDTIVPTESRIDQAYPALLAAYRAAVENYATARTNSVLLITDGPDDDSTVTGAKLLADLADATDAAHPVRVNVIVIGGNGTESLQNAAQRTGGTYTRVPSSDDIAFGTAMVDALTNP